MEGTLISLRTQKRRVCQKTGDDNNSVILLTDAYRNFREHNELTGNYNRIR